MISKNPTSGGTVPTERNSRPDFGAICLIRLLFFCVLPPPMPEDSMESQGNETHFASAAAIDSADPSYAGAFFPRSQHLVVAGGIFTSNTRIQQAPSLPSDFRVIPLGDIDLQKETRLDLETGVVGRGNRGRCVRRVYSAKIDHRKSNMTVAVYQGADAEERWRREITRYSCLRHPNILQIYGVASSCGMYATVFHDDLIPFQQFLDQYHHSPILTVYIRASCAIEWDEARNYFHYIVQDRLHSTRCTLWIRRSNRRLCVDLERDTDTRSHYLDWPNYPVSTPGLILLDQPNPEAMATSSLSFDEYHSICDWHLSQWLDVPISSQTVVKLRSVISWSASTRLGKPVEVAFLSEPEASRARIEPVWKLLGGRETASEITVESGWTRHNACDIGGRTFVQGLTATCESWLSQANHIFSRLQIKSDCEDFVFVYHAELMIRISPNPEIPEGFLFLCPTEDFEVTPDSLHLPDVPAYWSLDPSGDERLDTEEAGRLGFPVIEPQLTARGFSWDSSVYTGLRQFHTAKGFDPDNQDVARHLQLPLYQLSGNTDLPSNEYVDENAPTTADKAGEEERKEKNTIFRLADTEICSLARNRSFVDIVQLVLMLFLVSFWLCEFALILS
ncbi:hypothetical protein C8R43DRAFT_1010652 [Mycena crocata]|nr:hypothetical protein C8R43DRAFT_1010652 [Mycena crocata]